MNRGYIYLTLAIVLGVVSFFSPLILQIILLWAALAALYYAMAYFFDFGEMLFKSNDGKLPILFKILMFPVLLGATIFNLVARSRDKIEPLHHIENGLWVSRRLIFTDLQKLKESPITAVLDVTAEFDSIEADFLGDEYAYLNIPVMDHHSPRISQLHKAIRWIDHQQKEGKEVLIHCALGQGRSVTVLLAYLKYKHPKKTFKDLLHRISSVRSNAKPNNRQLKALEKFSKEIEVMHDAIHIIYNPASGSSSDENIQKIKNLLSDFYEVHLHKTSPERYANEIAKELVEQNVKTIVAAGGDGTVSYVAKELINTNTTLGVIPLGTANAFATVLYGNAQINAIETACEIIASGATCLVDAAEVNDKNMILLAAVGFEQNMTELAAGKLKDSYGSLGYFIAGFQQLDNQDTFNVSLKIDDKKIDFETGSVVIANAAPKTSIMAQGGKLPDPKDGYLDVTVIKGDQLTENSARTILELLSEDTQEEVVSHFQGKNIQLETNPPQKVVIDGEIFDENPINVHIKEKSLRVFTKS